MRSLLMGFFRLMPLWFGIGFIAPLTAQSISALGWASTLPGSPIVPGLVLGVVWGGSTVLRGRWI